MLLERLAYRRLRGAQPLTLLMTSFAVSVALQGLFLLIFGPRPKGIPLPAFVDTSLTIGSTRIQALDLVTLFTTIVIVVGLTIFLRRTVLGLALRSAADDFQTTRLMGVRANAVVVGAFLISGVLAGVAGLFLFAVVPNVVPELRLRAHAEGVHRLRHRRAWKPAGRSGRGIPAGLRRSRLRIALSNTLNPYLDAIVFGVAIVILRWRPGGVVGMRLAETVRV